MTLERDDRDAARSADSEAMNIFYGPQIIHDLEVFLRQALRKAMQEPKHAHGGFDLAHLDIESLCVHPIGSLEGSDEARYRTFTMMRSNAHKAVCLHAHIHECDSFEDILREIQENIRHFPENAWEYFNTTFPGFPDNVEEHASEKGWQEIEDTLDSRFTLRVNGHQIANPLTKGHAEAWEDGNAVYEKVCDLSQNPDVTNIFLRQVPRKRRTLEVGYIEYDPLKRFHALRSSDEFPATPLNVEYVPEEPPKKQGYSPIPGSVSCCWDWTLDDLNHETIRDVLSVINTYADSYASLKVHAYQVAQKRDILMKLYAQDLD